MNELSDLSLGKYIRLLREPKRMSLLDLSNGTKIAYSHLSRIENDSTIPNPETIVKLANFLDGDLTLMLHKANNLPRVILDRLMERDRAVGVQTLRRAIANDADEPRDVADKAIDDAHLGEKDVAELREALEGLATLRPAARRAIIQMISVLHDDEADGDPG